jgi:hypothetical protein
MARTAPRRRAISVGPHTPPFPGAFEEIHAVVYPANRFGANLSAILALVQNGSIYVQTPFFTAFRFQAPLEVLTPVPEPATIVLFGSALAFALRAARRDKRKARDYAGFPF